jgi:hypothetical protein
MQNNPNKGLKKAIFKPVLSKKAQASAGTVDGINHLREKYRAGTNIQLPDWTDDKPLGGDRKRDWNRQVPVVVGKPSPHDRMFDIKQQYIAGQLRNPEDGRQIAKDSLGIALFDESDKGYLLEKEKQAQEIELVSFAESLYNLDDPATAALVAEKILPDVYSRREAEIDKQARIQAALAKIRLHGGFPRNKGEIDLLYAIQKGLIPMPQGALWDFNNWNKNNDVQRGIFNPLRYIAGVKPFDKADAVFTGTNAKVNIGRLPVAGRVYQ